MDVTKKRDIVLVGHAHCGKTTLAESILFKCGATTRKGDVMQGNTISDFNDDEIERRISINASFLKAAYNGHELQIIDAPGYLDFVGEMVSAIRAADAAVVVVDAVNGVEVGTEDAWNRLEQRKMPRIVFINKCDKGDVKTDEVLAAVKEQLSRNAVTIDLEASDVIEAVAESDDKLLEKYLESGSLSQDEVKGALRKAVCEGRIFPVIMGSAAEDQGIQDLLDAVTAYFPSPLERPPVMAHNGDENKKEIIPSLDGPFAALVFKSMFDPHLGQLSLARVFRGKLDSNSSFYNVTQSCKVHISSISVLQGKEQNSVNEAVCGDIIALPKLKNTHVNDSLVADKETLVIEPIKFPEPAISASIKPKSRADEEKISTALHRLCEEDRTVLMNRDTETHELILAGVGDLHLKVLLDRMKTRYHVEVDLGRPKVSYREAITKPASARHKYKKQSGGRGQYGDVAIEIAPTPRDGEEYEFVNKIFGGAIPKNFIPSAEKGIKQAIREGVLAGYPLVNIQVTLVDGSYHDVDSSDMAFQIAGAMALRDAVKLAGPVLLEPIMEVSVVIPDEFIGAISGDISSRRGRIMGSEARGKNQVTKATVPLSEMFTYATDLRSMTGGRGSYSMKFSHYEQAPSKLTQQVIAERQKKDE